MKKPMSQGFAATMIFMVIVVLGLIGGIGFYVYKQHNTSSSRGCCALPSQHEVLAEEADHLGSLELTDLGLKINIGSFTGLTIYRDQLQHIDNFGGYKTIVISFSTTALEAADDSANVVNSGVIQYFGYCAARNGTIGSIGLVNRLVGSYANYIQVKGTEWYMDKSSPISYTYNNCRAHISAAGLLDTAIKDFKDQVTVEKL